jgi:hypothetical protein
MWPPWWWVSNWQLSVHYGPYAGWCEGDLSGVTLWMLHHGSSFLCLWQTAGSGVQCLLVAVPCARVPWHHFHFGFGFSFFLFAKSSRNFLVFLRDMLSSNKFLLYLTTFSVYLFFSLCPLVTQSFPQGSDGQIATWLEPRMFRGCSNHCHWVERTERGQQDCGAR